MVVLIVLAVGFLAYSNGSNDNFKGVASIYGSGTTTYKRALLWATMTTAAGSVAALFWAEKLLKQFSGSGLVPDAIITPPFLLAVSLGAGVTVILATRLGFPVSTTHGLTGAMLGSGLVAAGSNVNFNVLGAKFFLPLLLGPVLGIVLGGVVYAVLNSLRVKSGLSRVSCVCVGVEINAPKTSPITPIARAIATPEVRVSVGRSPNCEERYAGSVLGFSVQGSSIWRISSARAF